jgi:ElaB/YqjD/DUF883 family membrane-anchored ribosome-binding protein
VSSTDDARREVEEARQRLVGTVGEIGTAIDQTKAEVQQKAKKAAPIAAGAAGTIVLVKVLRRLLRRRRR